MSPLIFLLLFVASFIILKDLWYAVHVFLKRRSKQVTFVIGKPFLEEQLHGISIVTPFYNERFVSKWGWRILAPKFSAKPVQSIPAMIARQFEGKWFIQLTRDGVHAPTQFPPGFTVEALREFGVIFEFGFLVYTPESIKRGAIASALSPGMDVFLVAEDWSGAKSAELREKSKKFRQSCPPSTLAQLLDETGTRGMIFSNREVWWVYHREPDVIERFLQGGLACAFASLCKTEDIRPAHGAAFPRVENLSLVTPDRSDGVVCELYLEEGTAVTYTFCGKKIEILTTAVEKVGAKRIEFGWARAIGDWLLPHLVHDRPYSRRTLYRFSVQYFVTAFYLLGACILGSAIVDNFGLSPVGLPLQILLAITIFCSFLSICLSLVYLLRAVFVRRRFVLPGI